MEFWVVVAAAGAGYVAQYLQSSSEEKKNLDEQNQFSKISTHEQSNHNKNYLQQLREIFCPFHKLARKRAKNEGDFRFKQLNIDSPGNTSSTDCATSTDEKDSVFRVSSPHTSTRNNDSGGSLNSTGVTNGMDLLYMGIVSGMISGVIANKREIEKVNDKLKWTKNLVQELEEELSVKEITIDEPTRQNSECTNHVAAEKHESMSEIEAELEAELERLEMNLKVSTFERISDFVEIDPEDEVDVAQGDLKLLDFFNVQCPGSSESDWDTSIVHSERANYPVSPRELSSRLHEVIESRLEARIKELETALLRSSQNYKCSEAPLL